MRRTILLPVAQMLHSSADPGQITSNSLFNYYVSHILVIHTKMILLQKPMSNFKKLDQLIFDMGPGVLSNIRPI
jgi:hypothetical protein